MGHLEKAFLQLTLEAKDFNGCCFLCLTPQREIEEHRYRKVIFGAKSSPLILQAVLKYPFRGFCWQIGDCRSTSPVFIGAMLLLH